MSPTVSHGWRPRALSALPVAVLGIYVGVLTDALIVGALVLLATLTSVVFRWRASLDVLAQLVVTAAGITVGSLLAADLFPEEREALLGEPTYLWTLVALSAVLSAAPRLWIARPLGGEPGSAAFGAIALMGAGGFAGREIWTDGNVLLFGVVVCVWGILQLVAIGRHDPGRPLPGRGTGRRSMNATLTVAVTVAVASPFMVALPSVHAWVIGAMSMQGQPRSGFSSYARLGSLDRLLLSDRLVLRVEGETDYLRGRVYSAYRGGAWVAASSSLEPVGSVQESGPQNDVRVTRVAGDTDRYFVPLGATRLTTPADGLRRDAAGLVVPRGKAVAIGFDDAGDGAGTTDGLAPPGPNALDIPRSIRGKLGRLATGWTRGARTASERVAAIATRLQTDYRYSLEFQATAGVDPVLDFLLSRKEGHCEYFASAMTLLARSVGVPARMVSGYRVTERNPLTGDWLVRERNAHAWTEVWLPGSGWRTVEATAAGELPMASRTPWMSALLDFVVTRTVRAWRWLTSFSIGAIVSVLGGLIGLFVLVRLRNQRRSAREAARHAGFAPRLPVFERWLQQLAERGLALERGETLGRFAERLPAEDAAVVRRYAAFRYGGAEPRPLVQAAIRARLAGSP